MFAASLLCFAAALPTEADIPTWSGQVAEIVNTKCAGCHQPGQSGPFDLLTYEDAVEHSDTIVAVIADDFMPPWPPSKSPALMHDRRLTSEQEAALVAWAENGTPAGDLAKAPKPTIYEQGWRLGEPDLVVEMSRAFVVPADGRDIYRWFALPVNLPEDRYITAIEFQSTAVRAVHHVLFYYDQTGTGVERERAATGQPGFRGMRLSPEAMIGGYVPGAVPQKYPEGIAVKLPAGSDLVLQTHFHPSGKQEREQSKVALYFADEPPERPLFSVQMPPRFGLGAGIDIPAGDPEWTLTDDFTLPTDVTAIGVSGHAHYICSDMLLTATLPDGQTMTLLEIDDWDLDWQGDYLFEKPVKLPAGTKLASVLHYDNSPANPDNPFSPPRRVKWGEESTDEMGSMTLLAITDNERDDLTLYRGLKRHVVMRAAPRRGIERKMRELPKPSVAERITFNLMDKSQDGKLQLDEVPKKYREIHALLDVNADGGVTQDEMKPLRAWLKIQEENKAKQR